MNTIKIEKEVTVVDVYVMTRTPDELTEVEKILAKTDLRYVGSEFSDSSCVIMDSDFWYKATSIDRHRIEITIPQLAELLGVEYPLKPKFEAGKWYIAETGTNIFCHNGEFDEYDDPCGYGVVCDANWAVANDAGWGGDYREATPGEVERALIAEAKRRYEEGDKLSMIVQDRAPDVDGRVYPPNPAFGYEEDYGRLWLDQGYSYCIFADGKWAEVIEQKQLPTLEELIAEAKSKITKKTREFPCWVEGTREIEVYRIGSTKYMTEKLAIIGYIAERLREEYL